MHFEILVEDLSGKQALETLLPKILGPAQTYNIHAYKGIGHIPSHMKDPKDASARILLNSLPKLLKGYGKAFAAYGPSYPAAVVVICDLDDRSLPEFLGQLRSIHDACEPKPKTQFCIAIEEGEAWLLGDIAAVKSAFPKAKASVLAGYVNDSICGTWERLADAVYPGGAKALQSKGRHAIGSEKFRWATEIPPRMDINQNASPSFCFLMKTLQALKDVTSPGGAFL